MKILIPNFSLSDSFVDNVSFTLKHMGHNVLNMGDISVKKAYSRLNKFINTVETKVFQGFSIHEKFVLNSIKKYDFDILLCLTQVLDERVLYECKKKGIITIAWWGDTPSNMTKIGLFSFLWDFVFLKDKYAVKKLSSLGINSDLLLEAMNPSWHKSNFSQKNNKLIIAGSFYDYRHFITNRLISDNIELGLYGPPLPLWASKEIKKIHTGDYITKENKSKVFGNGIAVLNSTAMREFATVNCRAFEIAGCGGLQIMENRESINECFEVNKEILVYDSYDELLSLLKRAEKYPKEMIKIRQAASKRALSEHTYQKRLEYIFSKI